MSRSTWMLVFFLCVPFGLIIFFYAKVSVAHNIDNTKQDWGYIEIKPGKNIFWWLYYTTANVTSPEERPLIVWLQGGPGLAASCYGNFYEIGPLMIDMKERNDTWIKEFNVLFIDYPAGIGFSYNTEFSAKLPRLKEAGDELILFMKKFLVIKSEWFNSSLYVFGQSYGGKVAAELTTKMHKEVKSGGFRFNIKGFGSFAGYISPIDFINNYGKIGLTLGMIDEHKYKLIETTTRKIKSAVNKGKLKKAHALEKFLFFRSLDGVDVHNFLEPILHIHDNQFKSQAVCEHFFEETVQPYLKINQTVNWRYFNTEYYEILERELIESVTDRVEYLLNNTDVKVIVLAGMLDYIVNVAGTVDWIKNLKWHGAKEWKEQEQSIFPIDDVNEAFVRKTNRLSYYVVLRAGHSIPKDNPKAVLEILRQEILEEFN